MIDLLDGRLAVCEATMANLLAGGVYSDGLGAGGKQITGLDAAVSVTPAAATPYGGITPSVSTFWQNKFTSAALDATTVDAAMNLMWASLVRGMDRPDLIVMDNAFWSIFIASLQAQQRFTSSTKAVRGFPTIQYMDADVVLDGGLGGFATLRTAYFLNTKFIHWRPHANRNMVALSPKRHAINQDAEISILAWAGNFNNVWQAIPGTFGR